MGGELKLAKVLNETEYKEVKSEEVTVKMTTFRFKGEVGKAKVQLEIKVETANAQSVRDTLHLDVTKIVNVYVHPIGQKTLDEIREELK
jgi:hypothetical protein